MLGGKVTMSEENGESIYTCMHMVDLGRRRSTRKICFSVRTVILTTGDQNWDPSYTLPGVSGNIYVCT